MVKAEVAADATFYICFLDDINMPTELKTILNFTKAHLTNVVKKEVKKSKNWELIKGHGNINEFCAAPFNLGECVRPFLSKQQIERGEHEIIVCSYVILQITDNDFFCILDDGDPRNFIEKNFNKLKPHLIGTPGYIEKCCIKYQILDKEKAVKILESINQSRFRVPEKVLNNLITRIQNS